jgi:DNA-binding NtrC family response regulator
LERQAIDAALRKTGQNVTEAAKLLGISRRTLHRKLAVSKKG